MQHVSLLVLLINVVFSRGSVLVDLKVNGIIEINPIRCEKYFLVDVLADYPIRQFS